MVSILMTAYNREQYISEAIDSVLASTYSNFELIIVDDRSKDNTVLIAQQYAQKDSRIRVYVNENNLGDYANRNRAASYATGGWIMSVDSDDMIHADGIEKVLEHMREYPNAKFGMYHYLGTELQYIEPTKAIHSHFFKKRFLAIGPGGTIIDRDFFNRIKGYPEKYGPANDMYFNLKATAEAGVVMLPFEFHFYRRHEGQEINNHFSYLYNNYAYLHDALKELNLFLSDKEIKWLNDKNNRRFLVNLSRHFIAQRNIKKIREAITKTGFGWRELMSGLFHLN